MDKYRGNNIEKREHDGVWIYRDTKEKVYLTLDRACGNCSKKLTVEGHDGCLGKLPGLMNACCGHGEIKNSYIQLMDGTIISGKNAKIIIDILKKL